MENLDTFLTVLYVMIDDLCKSHQLQTAPHPGSAPVEPMPGKPCNSIDPMTTTLLCSPNRRAASQLLNSLPLAALYAQHSPGS